MPSSISIIRFQQKYLLLFGIFLMFSCKSLKETGAIKKPDLLAIQNSLQNNQFNYDWLDMKAKVHVVTDKKKFTFVVNTRARKDSLMWINASMVGIAGARILISKDSLKVLDIIHKTYSFKAFNAIEQLLSLPGLNFVTFEQLLAGNYSYLNESNMKITKGAHSYLIHSETNRIRSVLKINPHNYNMEEQVIDDKLYKQKMIISYDDYQELDSTQFAYKRNILLIRNDTISVDIKFSRINKEGPLKFPFNVSSKYTSVE